jgi:shikimate 5-dehydrogenase
VGEKVVLRPIDEHTKMVGLLGDEAFKSPYAKFFNKVGEERELNIAYIPMNIRDDDIAFTIHGLKESKVHGVNISAEYVEETVRQLDVATDEVTLCGAVETISVIDGSLHGFVTVGQAVRHYIENNGFKKIAIVGGGYKVVAILYHLQEGVQMTLFNDIVEESLLLMQRAGKEVEIERLQQDMARFDVVIDVENFDEAIIKEMIIIDQDRWMK